jgi:hypothetical protein
MILDDPQEQIMQDAIKPPAVFLVTIKITARRPQAARKFAKVIALRVEEEFGLHMPPNALHYELNLTKWEPL